MKIVIKIVSLFALATVVILVGWKEVCKMRDRRATKTYDYLASTELWHVDLVTGQTRRWSQEPESSCRNRQEAVAMVQRTIDFWLVKLRDDIIEQQNVEVSRAGIMAVAAFSRSLEKMMREPFAEQWNLTTADFHIGFQWAAKTPNTSTHYTN